MKAQAPIRSHEPYTPAEEQSIGFRRWLRVSGLCLASAWLIGLAACGQGDDPAPAAGEVARQTAAAGLEAPAAASEPNANDLVVPPPDHARFDPNLSSAAEAQLQAFGAYERRAGGTEGTWEGRDLELFVFTSDRPFDEVHAHYLDASRQLGQHGSGEIEREALASTHPDQLQVLTEQHGLPQWYADGYRALYPQIQGRHSRSAEFTIDDRQQTGADRSSYRSVEITVMQPFLDLRAGELHEATVIQYAIMTMERVDGR
jgi:hypothetical protein